MLQYERISMSNTLVNENKTSGIFKTAGAFIAWCIGSGFSTGQEILQFFTSFNRFGYGALFITLVGYILIGNLLINIGYVHSDDENFNHFRYYCGKKLGKFYSWLVPLLMIPTMAVLISGAAATFKESYHLPSPVGGLFMAALVLASFLIGFEKFVGIASKIGPVLIIFVITISLISCISNIGNISNISSYAPELSKYHAAPNWIISGVLYVSLTFINGSVYYVELGKARTSKKEILYGATLGAAAIITAIFFMNTALLLQGNNIAGLNIPNLYLANSISYIFGITFSIILLMGIFSACSIMFWTVCRNFKFKSEKIQKISPFLLALLLYTFSLFSFGDLLGIVYPVIGYIGIIFTVRVIYITIKNRKNNSTPD